MPPEELLTEQEKEAPAAPTRIRVPASAPTRRHAPPRARPRPSRTRASAPARPYPTGNPPPPAVSGLAVAGHLEG